MCDASEYTYTKRTSGEVGGVIDERGNLHKGIHVVYVGRQSSLIIILQPQKHFDLQITREVAKNMNMHIFRIRYRRSPTPVEVGPHGKVPISCPILDLCHEKF